MRRNIVEFLRFLDSNPGSRNALEGQKLYDSGHIISHGFKASDNAAHKELFALCLQNFKGGSSGKCKHIAAVLWICLLPCIKMPWGKLRLSEDRIKQRINTSLEEILFELEACFERLPRVTTKFSIEERTAYSECNDNFIAISVLIDRELKFLYRNCKRDMSANELKLNLQKRKPITHGASTRRTKDLTISYETAYLSAPTFSPFLIMEESNAGELRREGTAGAADFAPTAADMEWPSLDFDTPLAPCKVPHLSLSTSLPQVQYTLSSPDDSTQEKQNEKKDYRFTFLSNPIMTSLKYTKFILKKRKANEEKFKFILKGLSSKLDKIHAREDQKESFTKLGFGMQKGQVSLTERVPVFLFAASQPDDLNLNIIPLLMLEDIEDSAAPGPRTKPQDSLFLDTLRAEVPTEMSMRVSSATAELGEEGEITRLPAPHFEDLQEPQLLPSSPQHIGKHIISSRISLSPQLGAYLSMQAENNYSSTPGEFHPQSENYVLNSLKLMCTHQNDFTVNFSSLCPLSEPRIIAAKMFSDLIGYASGYNNTPKGPTSFLERN